MEKENTNVKRLLIVDDEPSFLILLKRIFQKSGYKILTSENGQGAKNIIENEGCDLIITDKNLPDLSGMEILKIAKSVNPTTEVIILTGYDSKETMLEAIDNSAYAYLLKAEAMDNIRSIQNRVKAAFEKQDVILENQRLLKHLSASNTQLSQALLERERLEEKLVLSERMAAVGHFAAGISHELSAPLQGIYSLAQSICNAPDLELSQNYAQDILFHIDEAKSVIHEMKSFIKLEENNVKTEIKECFDAALGVCGSGPLIENVEIKEYGIEGVRINIDETELKQIFINLFQNALEAIHKRYNKEPGGILRVSVQQTNKDTKIEVRDNGTGIKEDDIPLLFDPHFTTKNTGPSKVGLGLNVTYRLLLKNHGKIQVESNVESGTVFLLTIPLSHSG